MNDNKCLFCGDIIPEGRQICPICEKEPHEKIIDLKKENSKLFSLTEHLQSLVTERWFNIKRLEEKNKELEQENTNLKEKAQRLASKSILNIQESTKKASKDKAVQLIEKAKKTLTQAYDAYRRNADANDEAGAEDMARYWDGQADATQKSIDLIDELLQEFKGEKENG
jgi:hypothetical protein